MTTPIPIPTARIRRGHDIRTCWHAERLGQRLMDVTALLLVAALVAWVW